MRRFPNSQRVQLGVAHSQMYVAPCVGTCGGLMHDIRPCTCENRPCETRPCETRPSETLQELLTAGRLRVACSKYVGDCGLRDCAIQVQ
jgi:hypothetical protein